MSRTASTEHEKKAFMTIVGGKWAEQVSEGTPNAKERKNKKEKTVYELHYNDVTGVIKSLKIEKKDFGKQLQVVIDDVGETYTLSIPVESKYFDSFCSKIGCADLTMEVKIVPYAFTPNGESKAKTGVNLYQHGNAKATTPDGKLPYFFTKEAPNGRPQPMKDGSPLQDGQKLEEEEWQAYFLQVSMFNQKYIEKLLPSVDAVAAREAKKTASSTQGVDSIGDGMPF